jgi:methanogenic corrinoid protein MtbC1
MQLRTVSDADFDLESFVRGSAGIASLNSGMPRGAIEGLAREVVTVLADRLSEARERLDAPSPAEIDSLCAALASDDPADAPRFIATLRTRGVGPDAIYLGHLAPAARRLGEMWDEDRMDFTTVSIAVSRIYGVMLGLRGAMAPLAGGIRRAAVFAPAPGENHTLGLTMAADIFREHGWDVDLQLGLDRERLVRHLSASACEVVGLSASDRTDPAELAALIVALRVRRPDIIILVSGQMIADHREIVASLGVDCAAEDPNTAMEMLEGLLRRAVA